MSKFKLIFLTLPVIGLYLTPIYADKSQLEAEIDSYVAIFEQGNEYEIRKALGQLQWSGISDERIWDYVAREVEKGIHKTDQKTVKHLAKRINALAYSGNKKYEPLMQKVIDQATSRKYSQYAKKAQRALPNYILWNPVISKDIENAPVGKLGEWRVGNMLKSDHAKLIRAGAKHVYNVYSANRELSDLAEKALLDRYKSKNDHTLTDALIWICKALGETGAAEYKNTLIKVANGAASKKLQVNATKYSKVL
jgi:hypothetical protein